MVLHNFYSMFTQYVLLNVTFKRAYFFSLCLLIGLTQFLLSVHSMFA